MDDIFHFIMEAEGDEVEPFDVGGEENSSPQVDASGEDQSPDADSPPPMSDEEDTVPGFDDSQEMGGEEEPLDEGGDDTEENPDKKDGKLSEKVSNILNQQLYSNLLNKNLEIENTINSINDLNSALPYDIINKNEEPLRKLKAALSRGQTYAIDSFIDNKYGENRMFYQKLDAVYTLLLDELNTNLKKVQTN